MTSTLEAPTPLTLQLRRLPPFSGLNLNELERLCSELTPCDFSAGDLITRQGSRGPRVLAFFVVLEGEAVVSVGGCPVRRLGPGDHFGEIALLEHTPRTATVTAATDLRCLALSGWAFRSLADQSPPFVAGVGAAAR
jgi:CRP-like cAMP-binding protein